MAKTPHTLYLTLPIPASMKEQPLIYFFFEGVQDMQLFVYSEETTILMSINLLFA